MIYKLAAANCFVNSPSSWMPELAEASICSMTSTLDLASIMQHRRKFLAALVEHEKRVEQKGANKRVAERLDMDPSHLSQILTGHRKCGEDVALKIAAKLRVSVETINQFGVDYSDLSIGQIPPGVIPLSGPNEAEMDRSLLHPPPSALTRGSQRTHTQEATTELHCIPPLGEEAPTIDGLLMSFSQKLANASPEVREQIIRLALIYIESPEQGGRVARAIRALLGEDGQDADTAIR